MKRAMRFALVGVVVGLVWSILIARNSGGVTGGPDAI